MLQRHENKSRPTGTPLRSSRWSAYSLSLTGTTNPWLPFTRLPTCRYCTTFTPQIIAVAWKRIRSSLIDDSSHWPTRSQFVTLTFSGEHSRARDSLDRLKSVPNGLIDEDRQRQFLCRFAIRLETLKSTLLAELRQRENHNGRRSETKADVRESRD
jgi:hypothetical protein